MNRRDFFKGLAAAAVVVKIGFYYVADKIVTPKYADPIVLANGSAAYGFDARRDGWFRCWAYWDGPDYTQSVHIKSILDRDTNKYPVSVVQFTKPPVQDTYATAEEAGINLQSLSYLPWGIQIEHGTPVNLYVKTS